MLEQIERLFADVLGPLLAVDDGGIELVEHSPAQVIVRLTGSYAGCPSRPVVEQRVVLPALRQVLGVEVDIQFASPRPHPRNDA